MTLDAARRRATRALLLGVVAACVLSPGWLANAGAVGNFRIRGQASSLLPGVPDRLSVQVRNPFEFPIVIRSISVAVGDASARCRAANLSIGRLAAPVRVRPGASVTTSLPIKLAAKAPKACQGRMFPLSFSGRAVRP